MNLLIETAGAFTKHDRKSTQIEWAVIGLDDYPEKKFILLPPIHSQQDLRNFLEEIDFDYNNGFGGQFVHGKIMLVDGSWFERAEYDGAEWWEYKECVSFMIAKHQLGKELNEF